MGRGVGVSGGLGSCNNAERYSDSLPCPAGVKGPDGRRMSRGTFFALRPESPFAGLDPDRPQLVVGRQALTSLAIALLLLRLEFFLSSFVTSVSSPLPSEVVGSERLGFILAFECRAPGWLRASFWRCPAGPKEGCPGGGARSVRSGTEGPEERERPAAVQAALCRPLALLLGACGAEWAPRG